MREAAKIGVVPAHPYAGHPVLTSAALRDGYDRDSLSRFGDASWDLSPAVFRENARRCHVTVHFRSIGDLAVETKLREFLYARLNCGIPGHRMRLPPASVRALFNQARRFLEFVTKVCNHCDLSTINQKILDGYVRYLRTDRRCSCTQIAILIEVVVDLHYYRDHMPSGGIPFPPWKGRSAYLVAGATQASGENKTSRIPETIISPLFTWALKYVTVFSADILAVRTEQSALEEFRDRLKVQEVQLTQVQRRKRQLKRLKAYLAKRQAEGRGVPIWTNARNGTLRTDPTSGITTQPVNAHLIHLYIGVDIRSGPEESVLLRKVTKNLIAEAITLIGTEIGGMDTPISLDPDTGRPWRTRFDIKSMVIEERMLQAACYIVCAYLTAMRDCEIQAMRTGCLSMRRSDDGLVERYLVKSTLYKRREARGQPETWITIEPVARAIEVLERLTANIRQKNGGDTLWRVLNHHLSSKDHISAEIVRQINAFRDHLNKQFGKPDAPIVPHGPNGNPWRLTTRQFRRTVAWHIANRPFGTVAGKIQYKHASIAAFEGYAGSSSSGFRNEVERERKLGQLDDNLEYFEQHRGGDILKGPAATRITGELQHAADKLGLFPGHIATPARVRTMLADVARTLFVGILNDCFFDPATALCLGSKNNQSGPNFGQCRPDRCPNSCITNRHQPLWEKAIADGEELLKMKRLSPLQREAIKRDVKRYRAAIQR